MSQIFMFFDDFISSSYADLSAFLLFLSSLVILAILVFIDFKERLLPNKYVFPFALIGIVFHVITSFSLLSIEEIIIGGVLGYGLLWTVRALGSWYYKQEALGLGDVKLMGAAGLWLGPEYLMLALSVGACLSIIHGIIHAVVTRQSLRRLEIPAGPGLIGGIFIMMIMLFYSEKWFIFA